MSKLEQLFTQGRLAKSDMKTTEPLKNIGNSLQRKLKSKNQRKQRKKNLKRMVKSKKLKLCLKECPKSRPRDQNRTNSRLGRYLSFLKRGWHHDNAPKAVNCIHSSSNISKDLKYFSLGTTKCFF